MAVLLPHNVSRIQALKLLQEAISKPGQTYNLLYRNFIKSGTKNQRLEVKPSDSFRVMQWNSLADALSISSPTENFIKCPEQALCWSYRKHRILEEILTYDPDILCLEEIDHFDDFFLPSLKKFGYDGFFQAKSNSPCLSMPVHSGPDGCAMFFKQNRFSVRKVVKRILEDDKGVQTNQVTVITIFDDNLLRRQICCAVAHLKAKEGNEQIRVAQGMDIQSAIRQLGLADNVPIIVCGDFNSQKTEPVYDLMEKNNYISAFKSCLPTACEPEFTSCKIRPGQEIAYTIDYVWHSRSVQALSYLQGPSLVEIKPDLLPSFQYPSDHISLAFDFGFCD